MATGVREQKKLETRRAIADAALSLALAQGPARVTVDQIAAEAGISPRTFFNYFPSKDDAILSTTDHERAAEQRRRLERRPIEEPPLVALRAILSTDSDDFEADAVRWSTRMQLLRAHPDLLPRHYASFATLERGLTEALAERLATDPDADPYPALVVASAISAMRVAIHHWDANDRTAPLDAVLDETFRRLADGLRPPGAP